MSAILKIKNQRFDFFNQTEINLKYASIESTFSFGAYFDSESKQHKSLFKPFSYPPVTIETENGTRLITGFVLNNTFNSIPKTSLASISGSSKTGVLTDCPIPVSEYPFEYNNLSLFEIAQKLCAPFGISVSLGSNASAANEVFPEITSNPTQKIAQFLSETAAQKNLVISHNAFGNLLIEGITAARTPKATFDFDKGTPGTKLSMSTKGQGMHSAITVMKQADVENDNAAEQTINNPFVSIFRPTTKMQSSGTDTETETAAKNALANELRNVQLRININRWTWPGTDEIIVPNRIVAVHDHDLFLYRKTNFFVEQVTLRENPNDGQTASLQCVIPEVYNGQSPSNIFSG